MNFHREPQIEPQIEPKVGTRIHGNQNEATSQLSVSSALIEVSSVMAMVMSMGNNDYELSALNTIIGKLQDGNYKDPEQAVEEAREIMNTKLVR